jgi:molybdate transport system regulatory protein
MAIPRLTVRVVLANGAILSPTKIALLEAIEAKGSITAAARSLQISYRHAWLLVQSINDMLRGPAVVTETGGTKGGGAKLSVAGKQVVAIYHAIQSKAHTASFRELHALGAMTRKRKPSRRIGEKAETP